MNIADLSKLDIKELQKIDYQQLAKDSTKRPDVIVNVVAILLCLVLSFHFFSKNKATSNTLKYEVNKLEEKVVIIDAYNQIKAELTKFQNSTPQHYTVEQFINTVSDLAFNRNIQIKTLTPIQEKKGEYYNLSSIVAQIVSPNYTDIWLFIHDIERSEVPLRIDEWEGSMQSIGTKSRRVRGPIIPENHIEVKLTVSIVNYNDI